MKPAAISKMTVAFGGFGAAIDFLLGKNGQKKVRD
jgi:hypothetical protein